MPSLPNFDTLLILNDPQRRVYYNGNRSERGNVNKQNKAAFSWASNFVNNIEKRVDQDTRTTDREGVYDKDRVSVNGSLSQKELFNAFLYREVRYNQDPNAINDPLLRSNADFFAQRFLLRFDTNQDGLVSSTELGVKLREEDKNNNGITNDERQLSPRERREINRRNRERREPGL